MSDGGLTVLSSGRLLTEARFKVLADVPAELEWFANIGNTSTRRAYENALQDFMGFTGIRQPGEFRIVTRSHVIAWRDDLVSPCSERHDGPPPVGRPLLFVRAPVREQCGDAQPG